MSIRHVEYVLEYVLRNSRHPESAMTSRLQEVSLLIRFAPNHLGLSVRLHGHSFHGSLDTNTNGEASGMSHAPLRLQGRL